MRVMTYNIKTGGVDRGRGSRLDAIVAVVNRQRPDLLGLQELRGFRPGGARLRHFAEAVGMRPFLARSWFGQPVAVLVRPPGRPGWSRGLRWGLHHAAAAVVVHTDRGSLTVVATHLNPFFGQRRLREAGRLVARFARPGAMTLLMGDLNSLDPHTPHEERLTRLPATYRRRHLHAGAGGAPVVDTRTVARLAGAGFVDLWRAAGCAEPDTTAPTAQGGGAEFSGMRLDYVLGTAPVAALVRDCRTVTGAESDYASDHYPVVADLDLSFR